MGEPGPAASLDKRNRSSFVALNVKPITGGGMPQKPFDPSIYKPNHYLEPDHLFAQSAAGRTFYDKSADGRYGQAIQVTEKKRKVAGSEVRSAFKTWTNANPALNHIHNRKVEISKEKKENGVVLGNSINNHDAYLDSLNTTRTQEAPKRGHTLSEANNYVSQIGRDTSTDRINVRRTTKDYDTEQPDFLRLLENKKYHPTASELAGKNGILTVLSKTRGWLTVTPNNTDRKCPIDQKQPPQKQRHPSMMAPLWIHQQSAPLERGEEYLNSLGRRLNHQDDMQSESPMHSVLIKERKRMFLVDKIGHQPQKSMFNIGDYRHNKNTGPPETNNKVPLDTSPQRFLTWNERKESNSPSRDATFTRFVRQDVTGKIGQPCQK